MTYSLVSLFIVSSSYFTSVDLRRMYALLGTKVIRERPSHQAIPANGSRCRFDFVGLRASSVEAAVNR
jgi:hypothetical protein